MDYPDLRNLPMKRVLLGPFITLLLPLHAATAQRQLDLTGTPDAVIREAFSRVDGVRELAGGQVVATDQVERSVFLVDFGTGRRQAVGRPGDGPGEYRFPLAPLAGQVGAVWLPDATLRRIQVVTPEGRLTAGPRWATAEVPGGVGNPRGTDNQGRIYFEGSSFDADRGAFLDSVAVFRWNPGENRGSVLTRVWSGGRVRVGEASLARSITPYPHLDAWAVLPDGQVAIIHHNPFRLDILGTDGTVRRGAAIPHTPLPVTAADRQAFRDRTAALRSSAMIVGGGSGPPSRGPQFADEDFPRTMPPFIAAAVRVTPEGEIWIGRSHAATDRTWRYDIFDASGRHVGVATLRRGATVVGFGRGSVYVARTDPDDDLVYLERHRR
jgi:hypothetical protein